jgi:FkbM family methyltransferase
MISLIKDGIRALLTLLAIDLTKNIKYDRLTRAIIASVLSKNSNCIDVGCHKGEILDLLIKYAPSGKHYAFEPLPELHKKLVDKYAPNTFVFPYALSDREGNSTFNYVKNQPAYSGILKRKYNVKNPEVEEIAVTVKTLDAVIPEHVKIDLIKIDVEGGEFGVLKGGVKLLKRDHPLVIFECGMGASEYYGTTPEALFEYMMQLGYAIFLLDAWLKKTSPLSLESFCSTFKNNSEYYFIAEKIKPVI